MKVKTMSDPSADHRERLTATYGQFDVASIVSSPYQTASSLSSKNAHAAWLVSRGRAKHPTRLSQR